MRYVKPTRPTQLPELRAQLVDDEWIWAAVGVLGVLNPAYLDAGAIRFALQSASLWWVASDCCDLLAQAAPAMPDVTLTEDLVPDDSGFACLERPLSGSDAMTPGVEVSFDYIQWLPTVVQGQACVSIVLWRVLAHDESLAPIPLGRSEWPYRYTTEHRLEDVTDLAHQSIVEDRRLLAALWQLSSQPNVTTSSDVRPDRPARRRLTRAGHQPSPVRLVHLNRASRRTASGPQTGDRQYTCRWLVKGHWRQQAYGPGRSLRRATYIAQHVRGPADKPLRIRDTVKVWNP